MSLQLSKIVLNTMSGTAMRLAGDISELHRVIYALFEDPRDGRILFRVETHQGQPIVLIQSPTPPDWEQLPLEARDLCSEPMTKNFSPNLIEGAEYSFRLLARVTRRSSSGTGKPAGARRDLRSDEERLEWLHRKGSESGFAVTACGLTILTFPSVHSDKGYRAKGGSFSAVQFDGTLIVSDAEKLRHAITHGLGTQKGFGFGLLSLATT
jgi:CRISPR system Cascade subunit CasE